MRIDLRHRSLWLTSALLLSITLIAAALSSCNDDEPLRVGYYLTVGSRNPQEGYVPKDDMAYVITLVMQDSIRAVYPKPNKTGNDTAVLNACNNVYRKYRNEHPEYFAGGYTVARLHRGWMNGTVIKSSSVIATWNF